MLMRPWRLCFLVEIRVEAAYLVSGLRFRRGVPLYPLEVGSSMIKHDRSEHL